MILDFNYEHSESQKGNKIDFQISSEIDVANDICSSGYLYSPVPSQRRKKSTAVPNTATSKLTLNLRIEPVIPNAVITKLRASTQEPSCTRTHVGESGHETLPGAFAGPSYLHPLYGASVKGPRDVGKLTVSPALRYQNPPLQTLMFVAAPAGW